MNPKNAVYDLVPQPEAPDPLVERHSLGILGVFAATPLPTPVAPPEPPRPVYVKPEIVVGNGQLKWPVPGGTISQYYSASHLALDISAPSGSAVIAAAAGVVTWAGWKNNGGGLVIAIDHGNGIVTLYNHLGTAVVAVGATVTVGQTIGNVGCSGDCTGPHVHFEVVVADVIVNPLRYL